MQNTTGSQAAVVAPSLRALLDDIVDYAGLFPPADLPLDTAIWNYARYRRTPEAWMLARFVLPVARLAALSDYDHLFAEDPPFRFAVLGTGGQDTRAFQKSLEEDLVQLAAFLDRHRRHVEADVLEVRLPEPLLHANADAMKTFFEAVALQIAESPLPRLDVYYEVPLDPELRGTLPRLLAGLQEVAARTPQSLPGLKMRTGGLDPMAFPKPAAVAYVIAACRDACVRFKATAGLHHPVRHFAPSVGADMYGFLNVFGAAVLADAHGLPEEVIQEVLLDEATAHFRFEPYAFRWKDYEVPSDAVRRTRSRLAISFGSCSFDEPRDDLRALGLL